MGDNDKKGTDYVVFRLVGAPDDNLEVDDGDPLGYMKKVGTTSARTNKEAIKALVTDDGSYVAVPVRNLQVLTVKTETTPKVTIS